MTRRSEQEIRDLFVAAKAKLGDDVGEQVFCKEAGVKRSEIAYHFGDFGTLRETVGLSRNTLQERLPDSEVFADYARVCLHLRKIPSPTRLRVVQRKLGTRTSTVYSREPGGIIPFQRKFRSWLLESGDDALKPILCYRGWAVSRNTVPADTTSAEHRIQPNLHPFLPGCLQYLDVLAKGQLPPFESAQVSTNTLFERRVGDAFRSLGFEISPFGQGTGRKADAVASSRRDRVAMIIDAKVRADGYVLGVEDRKFLEYATAHGRELLKEGFEQIYFVVVGPTFREADLTRLAEYLSATPIRSVVMLTARALMRVVEDSIRDRSSFSIADFVKEIYVHKIISK